MAGNEYIRNALILSGGIADVMTNSPEQYAERQTQYFGNETSLFTEKYAKYASDFFRAQAQGLNRDDPTKWETIYLRMADIGRATANSSKLSDDYKRVLIANRSKDYVRPGTKIVTMGSTWLAINPNNISGVGAGGIVQRCNAVWNYLDWYGNVKSEPIAVDRYLARANNTDTQEAMNLTKGYFDVKCQNNAATQQLAENSRMILGRNCYRITGFSDFTQEFTGDYDSVRLLEFSIHFEEPNLTIDDMENHVAGGKEFSWEMRVSGQPNMSEGETTQFSASSQRNNENVVSTEEHPITYLWSSSDENVATVDAQGAVTAVGEGTCVIAATLAENPAKSAQMAVAVAPAEAEGTVKFLSSVPETLSIYESVTLEAGYFLDGKQTDAEIQWYFDGANKGAYSAEIDGNTAIITCWSGSVEPLRVTVYYPGSDGLLPRDTLRPDDDLFPEDEMAEGSISAKIRLEGL